MEKYIFDSTAVSTAIRSGRCGAGTRFENSDRTGRPRERRPHGEGTMFCYFSFLWSHHPFFQQVADKSMRIIKQEEDIFKVCLFRLLLISEIVYVTVVNKFALFSRTAIS